MLLLFCLKFSDTPYGYNPGPMAWNPRYDTCCLRPWSPSASSSSRHPSPAPDEVSTDRPLGLWPCSCLCWPSLCPLLIQEQLQTRVGAPSCLCGILSLRQSVVSQGRNYLLAVPQSPGRVSTGVISIHEGRDRRLHSTRTHSVRQASFLSVSKEQALRDLIFME